MTTTQKSRFLTLPLEVRLYIYEDLLCPDPSQVLQLYHDRRGREPSFNIDPAILRVNKQIHSEAVDVLYEKTIFEISLYSVVRQDTDAMYQDDLPDPPPLLRNDYEGPAAPLMIPHVFKALGFDPTKPGLIHPHCLQRMHHIKLGMSNDAIWAQGDRGCFFSHAGDLILTVLDLLGRETPAAKKKVCKFVAIEEAWIMRYRGFQKWDDWVKDEKAVQMAALMTGIKKTRHVNVVEKESGKGELGLEIRELDFERFASVGNGWADSVNFP